MIQGKWFPPGSPLQDALSIRQQVFQLGGDELDHSAWNVVVYDEEIPCGTGRIWWAEGAFHLGDIGVLPASRHRKLGDLVLRLLLFKAQSHSARLIQVQCPPQTTGFFTRLGFLEANTAGPLHTLLLRGEDICLDTCQGCTQACPHRR